ncbi:hypothetical protein RHGRI_013103 [Rhododendron griersonianum]|uniref:Uncharacterized protein n=1 Tax=Rhododendron griersonianum TaxID=479676 RepID=A0AAV6K4P2_9ERIC|nr:hypothetical protein RHGRI_013103 [Rhododendron griersonianum]
MAGVLVGNFPDLLESNPLSCARVLASTPSRVRSQGSTIDLLDKASVPMDSSDGPALRQIKELNVELINLKRLLDEKDKVLQQAGVTSSGISNPSSSVVPPVSWKDKVVAGEPVVPRMALQYFAPSVVNEKLVVNPPEEVVLLGSEKWKDCVVGYFIDPNGDRFSIKVWYPWRPLKCDKCKVFGHRTCQDGSSGVPKLGTKQQVWVVKGGPNPVHDGEQVQVTFAPSRTVTEAVLEPFDSVISQEDQVLVSGQLVGGSGPSGVCLDEVHMPGFAQRVTCVGNTSDPNKFAVLQLPSNEVLAEGVALLPSEAEFHDGLIHGVESVILPPAKKSRGRNKGGGRKYENIRSTMAVCFPHSWKAVHNYTTGPVARIFLGWDSAVFSVSPVFTSDQIIIVEVDLIQDKRNFLLSVVYGHNRIGDRRSLWEDMSC